jgi:hypothetical protein
MVQPQQESSAAARPRRGEWGNKRVVEREEETRKLEVEREEDWVEEKDLAPAMWRVVVKLEDRRVSEVITFGGNYYIFWIEGRQAGKMKPKEEVDAEIERRIMMERKRVATEKWMEKLRKKATIIRY